MNSVHIGFPVNDLFGGPLFIGQAERVVTSLRRQRPDGVLISYSYPRAASSTFDIGTLLH